MNIALSDSQRRVDRYGSAIFCQRGVTFALIKEDVAQSVVPDGKLRIECEGPSDLGESLVTLTLLAEDITQ